MSAVIISWVGFAAVGAWIIREAIHARNEYLKEQLDERQKIKQREAQQGAEIDIVHIFQGKQAQHRGQGISTSQKTTVGPFDLGPIN